MSAIETPSTPLMRISPSLSHVNVGLGTPLKVHDRVTGVPGNNCDVLRLTLNVVGTNNKFMILLSHYNKLLALFTSVSLPCSKF